MDIEQIRAYALQFKESSEGFPFDSETLVFKVAGKMFLLVSLEAVPLRFSFKNLPEKGLQYRESYPAVEGAYHMNKTHWSMVQLDGSVPAATLQQWIKESHDLVVSSLPKYKQKELLGHE
jgi:predicted DNA-binding protein (MmcQ/YjbR family)